MSDTVADPDVLTLNKPWRGLNPIYYQNVRFGDSSFKFVISSGSVVDFTGDAIINAANEGCIGGGAVDGAISRAGGRELFLARLALPILDKEKKAKKKKKEDGEDESESESEREMKSGIRCRTGSAVVTIGGSLKCKWVIHAVGPIYGYTFRAKNPEKQFEEEDGLLRSAYVSSMKIGKEKGLQTLAFSLLSAGVFRGSRSLEDVLTIAVDAILEENSLYPELKEVHLVAFLQSEKDALLSIMKKKFPETSKSDI